VRAARATAAVLGAAAPLAVPATARERDAHVRTRQDRRRDAEGVEEPGRAGPEEVQRGADGQTAFGAPGAKAVSMKKAFVLLKRGS